MPLLVTKMTCACGVQARGAYAYVRVALFADWSLISYNATMGLILACALPSAEDHHKLEASQPALDSEPAPSSMLSGRTGSVSLVVWIVLFVVDGVVLLLHIWLCLVSSRTLRALFASAEAPAAAREASVTERLLPSADAEP